jgi:pyruvate formate lyase activating enzyme
MKIGGFVKQSFCDWEGKLAAVIFTQGCNFRCAYCHNPSLVLPELIKTQPTIPEADFFCFLKQRIGWLDAVVISGGEPTMQADLPEFIAKLKNMGFPVKLDTNGTHPEILALLFKNNLLDFVAMDIKSVCKQVEYETVTGVSDCKVVASVLNSIALIIASGISFQFRTTLLPNIHNEKIKKDLLAAFYSYPFVFQEYREGNNLGNYLKCN